MHFSAAAKWRPNHSILACLQFYWYQININTANSISNSNFHNFSNCFWMEFHVSGKFFFIPISCAPFVRVECSDDDWGTQTKDHRWASILAILSETHCAIQLLGPCEFACGASRVDVAINVIMIVMIVFYTRELITFEPPPYNFVYRLRARLPVSGQCRWLAITSITMHANVDDSEFSCRDSFNEQHQQKVLITSNYV